MQGAKPIRSLPLQAQAVAGRQPNLPVNSSEDSTLCLPTRANLRVNSHERHRTGITLYPLTRATLGLTTKRERERVSGSELARVSPVRPSLVNTSRGRPKGGAKGRHNPRVV